MLYVCIKAFLISFRWNWLNQRKGKRLNESERERERTGVRAQWQMHWLCGQCTVTLTGAQSIDDVIANDCNSEPCTYVYMQNVRVLCVSVCALHIIDTQIAKAIRLKIHYWCWLMQFYAKYLIWVWKEIFDCYFRLNCYGIQPNEVALKITWLKKNVWGAKMKIHTNKKRQVTYVNYANVSIVIKQTNKNEQTYTIKWKQLQRFDSHNGLKVL